MRKKLRSHGGFSLSELLTAVAILGLLTSAVAVGVPAVLRVYRQVTVRSEASVLCGTLSTALADELRQAAYPQSDGSFYSANYGGKVSVGHREGRVLLGDTPLLSDAAYSSAAYSSTAYTGGLWAEATATYSGGQFTVEVTIKRAENKEVLTGAEFTVTPLNP